MCFLKGRQRKVLLRPPLLQFRLRSASGRVLRHPCRQDPRQPRRGLPCQHAARPACASAQTAALGQRAGDIGRRSGGMKTDTETASQKTAVGVSGQRVKRHAPACACLFRPYAADLATITWRCLVAGAAVRGFLLSRRLFSLMGNLRCDQRVLARVHCDAG